MFIYFVTDRKGMPGVLHTYRAINMDHVVQVVPYEEQGKPCGCVLHFADRSRDPLWVSREVESIVDEIQRGGRG